MIRLNPKLIFFGLLFSALALSAVQLEFWHDRLLREEESLILQEGKLRAREISLKSQERSISGDGILPGLWVGESENTLLAIVQSRISEISERNGVQLRLTKPTTPSPIGQVSALGIHVEADIQYDNFISFLHELEAHGPEYIIVDNISLRVLTGLSNQSAQPRVSMQLDVIIPYEIGDL